MERQNYPIQRIIVLATSQRREQIDDERCRKNITRMLPSKRRPATPRPIALMMRNLMPQCECIECKKPAIWLCMECFIEEGAWRTLCDEHVKTHPTDNYGEPVKLVNSPRLGLCGYDGPAEPPY